MADAEPDRLHGLDLIRGLAVMGIALMNVASFALPPAAYDNPLAYGTASPLDLAVWAVEFVFVDGKLRALFSILFGASLMLVADREDARGGNPLALHLRRMAVLLAIGFAHALLLWPGDILVMYAIAGAAAYAVRDRPIVSLLVAALICLAGQALVSGLTLSAILDLRHAALAPHADVATRLAWERLVAVIGRDEAASAQALALHLGSYGDLLAQRLDEAVTVRVEQLAGAGFETLGLMLLGMAALRSGALSGDWPRSRYRRIAKWAIATGAAAGTALLILCVSRGLDPVTLSGAAVLGGAPLRPLMALGYAAAALTIRPSALTDRVRAVGRMALSAYVGTSLVFALLFDGYGLGLFGRLSRAELLLPVLLAWLLMLAICAPWLARFLHGPLEWLWRSLARGTVQPFRRRFTIAT